MWKVVCGFLLLVGILPAQDIKSLIGLPPLTVDVDVMSKTAGISGPDLKAAAEARLTSSGIKLATGLETVSGPQMFIAVGPVKEATSTYGVGVFITQYVKPYRADPATAPTLLMNTWSKNASGKMADGNPVTPTKELVEKLIDDFVADYRKANSK